MIDQTGEIEEMNRYYPFGGMDASSNNAQHYKYNGKELDANKGLNWYDYGAAEFGGIALGKFVQWGLGHVLSKVTKNSGQGGLNLFKWGAEQTTKSESWKTGDYMLYLPDKGSPKLNWKANYSALRREIGLGKPIYDSYRLPNGGLIPTGGFLNAERFTLQTRGWTYSSNMGAWLPPIK